MTPGQPPAPPFALARLLAGHIAAPPNPERLLAELSDLLFEALPLADLLAFLPDDEGWRMSVERHHAPQPDWLRERGGAALAHTGSLLPSQGLRPEEEAQGRRVLPLLHEERAVALLDFYPTRPLVAEEEQWLAALREPLALALARAQASLNGHGTARQGEESLAEENRRLRREVARHVAASEVVQETAGLVATALHVEDILQHLLGQLVRRFEYPYVAAYLHDGSHFVLVGQHGFEPERLPTTLDEQRGVAGRAIRERRAQWVAELASDPDFVISGPEATSKIVVPVQRGSKVLGLVLVEGTAQRPLDPDDLELLETLGDQLATAISNAQLFNELERHALQLETASEVSRRVASILNIDQLLGEVARLIQRNFGYYHVHIFMRDGEGGWVVREGAGVAAARMKELRHRRASEEGIVGRVGATGMSLLVPDVSDDSRHVFNPHLPDTHAELAVPLRLGAQIFGVLDVQSDKPHGLTASDQDMLETLANQVAVALNNAHLFGEIEEQLAERERLYRASYAVSGALDAHQVLAAVLEPLAPPHLLRAGLLLPLLMGDDYPESLEVAGIWNPTNMPLQIQPGTHLHASVLPALHQMATDHVQVVEDVLADPRLDATTRAIVQGFGVRSLALVPLRAGGRVIGWLLLMSERLAGMDERLLQPFQSLADQAALAVERVRLLEQTQQRAARLDALTRLASNIAASLDLPRTLEESVAAMAQLLRVRQSGLLLFEQNNLVGRLVAQYREDDYRHTETILVPLTDNPLTERLLTTRAPVYITDIATDPLAVRIREGTHPRSYTAILVLPLLVRDRVIGSISLDVLDERRFAPDEVALAQAMANQIAIALNNAHLYEEATQRASFMETGAQVGQLLTRYLNEESLIREVVEIICDRFDLYFVGLYLRDSDFPNRLALREGSGALGRVLRGRRQTLWEGQGLPGHVLEGGDSLVANDAPNDPRHLRHAMLPESAAEAALPLRVGGELIGVLDLHSRQSDFFQPEQLSVLAAIADSIAIALQNAHLFANQRDSLERLQEVDRLKSEFLANMSHELRTPLNSIIGFSKIMLRGINGPLTEPQEQDLTAIYNSGYHLLALINEILDLSKISAGKMELRRESVAVPEVVDEVLRSLAPQGEERKLRLDSDPEADLPLALADRLRLRQILMNLLSNAIKFTDQGGVFVSARRVASARPSRGTAQCVGDSNGAFIEVAVRDTGIGIRADDQGAIFEEFRQVESAQARRSGGTGLGLAIARRFTQLHGGEMWVESRHGSGSTFRFTLPVAEANTT